MTSSKRKGSPEGVRLDRLIAARTRASSFLHPRPDPRYILVPSLSTIYVVAALERELSDQAKQSMPNEVQMQVNPVQTATWDSQSRLVLGPRFAADASREQMAANFFNGISFLAHRSQLDRNSPFVQQSLDVVNNGLQNDAATALTTDSMPFLSQSSSDLERVIASAMEISSYSFRPD